MSKKVVFYLSGGGMLGLFGAGVLAKIQELDIYNNIEAVYACSAGIFNGGYFLTRQMDMGSSIYYEELTQDFIKKRNMFYGLLQRLWNGYISPLNFEKIVNVMHLDRLIEVVERNKILDINALKRQTIPLYVKLLNASTLEIEYKDIRQGEPLQLLKAGSSAIPYYFPLIKRGVYIDAAIKEPLGLEYLLERYPDSKIIVIFNLSIDRNIWHYIKNILEGVVANAICRESLSKCFLKREDSIRRDLKIARENERILLLHPLNNSVECWTKDKRKLKKLYEHGKDVANKVVEFL